MQQTTKIIIISVLVWGVVLLSLATVIFFALKEDKAKPLTKTENFAIPEIKPEDIRQPAVAGQFYPADPKELEKMIDDYLSQAEIKTEEGIPQILIAPHAGYIYSGQVAAYAFKKLAGTNFKRVVIIGRSHQQFFSDVAADTHKVWTTPLGQVKVDQDFIELLKTKTSGVVSNSSPHNDEHSLEVMLPFLIKTLGKDIKVVPLLFGNEKQELSENLAQALAQLIDRKTLIVISTDLSHYPNYADANNLDKQTIEAILTNDISQFKTKISQLAALNINQVSTLACAQPAILTAMILARSLNFSPQLLKYANSGDYFPEQKNQVVGYGAIAFNNLNFGQLKEDSLIEEIGRRELNSQEQKIALTITRQTLAAAFANQDYQPKVEDYAIFQLKRGAFVTLRKQGQLRGCIGAFEPEQTLAEVIKSMALAAAFNDPRFVPLAANELNEIKIEISVLSPREKIADHNLIEVGKHGVYVQKGAKSGVYLPQVATEQDWDKETFLNSLCAEKAGLNRDCWRDGSTDLYIFTAQIFEESE